MIRRFLKERISNLSGDSSEDGSSSLSGSVSTPKKAPPPMAFEAGKKQKKVDANTLKVEELAPFDACIEACDELASTSTSSGRFDKATGLVDCSVLVSADGNLLIIPEEQQHKKTNDEGKGKRRRMESILERAASELGAEYESAIFMGNDLDTAGDKALNGFSAKGWSITAASLAMKQSSDVMIDLADFVEDLVLTKKTCAAQENQMVNKLRLLVEGPAPGSLRVDQYQQYLKEAFPDQTLEVLATRVGPLSSPGGTIQASLVAMENYYSTIAESESGRWRSMAGQSGALTKLKLEKERADQRAMNRQTALQEMYRRAKCMEDLLTACKEDAALKWTHVHEAEEKVTTLVEEKMIERSRLREQQRLEQIKNDEKKRAKDAAKHGNLGATSSEVWDIVSAVAASMEEGSFEPMDLPQAPLSAPRDKSRKSEAASDDPILPEEEALPTTRIPFRHELEQACGLPELRVAALAADESVNDAANSLLNVLHNWDTASRSARLAAETCLVSVCNSQAACLRTIVDAERESLRERLKLLDELEHAADHIDVRADMNHYITLDKKHPGGRSFLGDDDDGGIASALAVLNNHIDGNMGMGKSSSYNHIAKDSGSDDDEISPEHLQEAVEQFFRDNALLRADAPDNESTEKAKEQFETSALRLCKIGKDKKSSARSQRSTICYSLNAKRNIHSKIHSEVQFDGLWHLFTALLSGCDTDSSSGASLAKMLMTLSPYFYYEGEENGESEDGKSEQVHVKSKLVGHPLWEKEGFW
jgi:hypothetical protein